jgi:hypothetical protein
LENSIECKNDDFMAFADLLAVLSTKSAVLELVVGAYCLPLPKYERPLQSNPPFARAASS